MRVEVFRAGETLVFELALPAPEAVEPAALLEEMIEGRVLSPVSSATWREPEQS
jgi:hypothetical protein